MSPGYDAHTGRERGRERAGAGGGPVRLEVERRGPSGHLRRSIEVAPRESWLWRAFTGQEAAVLLEKHYASGGSIAWRLLEPEVEPEVESSDAHERTGGRYR